MSQASKLTLKDDGYCKVLALVIATPPGLADVDTWCTSAVQALRPTLFIGVPRVFDKLYDGVYAKLALARPTQRLLFHLAFWWKQRQIRAGYKWDKVLVPPETGLTLAGHQPDASKTGNAQPTCDDRA